MHACVRTVLGPRVAVGPPMQTVLCAYSLPLRDKGQVSHPTESAQKGEDDSQVQTDPKDSPAAEEPQLFVGLLESRP